MRLKLRIPQIPPVPRVGRLTKLGPFFGYPLVERRLPRHRHGSKEGSTRRQDVGALNEVQADMDAAVCEPIRKAALFRELGRALGVVLDSPPTSRAGKQLGLVVRVSPHSPYCQPGLHAGVVTSSIGLIFFLWDSSSKHVSEADTC